MKRVLDLVGASVALVILAPLMVVAAAAILLEDGRPILFRQVRVGRGDREFLMYKFRSMVRNAAERGPYFTLQDDDRITRVGRIIRRTSVDELPQLFNVIVGDMSLVGPRPDVPEQRTLYRSEDWAVRCSVRPGVTGLAQALLRSEGSQEQRLELDLRYACEHNLWTDLKIMWWTLGRLSGKGSN
jgi:lipopolysaccharide/colanic/teichoic acid biosynthesis glycosyltransferase